MRCPRCHHDSVCPIVNEENFIVVCCNNCEHEFIVADSPLLEIFLYNFDAEQRKGEGRLAFLAGESIFDCPYSDDVKEVWSRGLWIKGWTSEQESMEGASNLLSAKKENEEEGKLQREKIASLSKKLKLAEELINKKTQLLKDMDQLRVDVMVDLQSMIAVGYWFGGSYRTEIQDLLDREWRRYKALAGIL